MSNTTQAHTNFGFLMEHSPLLHKLGLLAEKYYADDPSTAIPTAVYTFGCMFTGTLLASYWSWRGIPLHATTLEPQLPPLQQNT